MVAVQLHRILGRPNVLSRVSLIWRSSNAIASVRSELCDYDASPEHDAALGGLAAACGEASWRRSERPEVSAFESAVERACERGIGDEDEVVVAHLGVEFVGGSCPVE